MFNTADLNITLRALVNEFMRLRKAGIEDNDLAKVVSTCYNALLAAPGDQVDYDDARAVYDFFCEVRSGGERPEFVE